MQSRANFPRLIDTWGLRDWGDLPGGLLEDSFLSPPTRPETEVLT